MKSAGKRAGLHHVLLAAELEAQLGAPRPALLLPRNAPDDLKGMAIIVYFLGGPGREYVV